MKGKLYIASLIFSLPLMAWAQSDVYYIPSKKVKTVVTTHSSSNVSSRYDQEARETTANTSDNYMEYRDVDEYNRRSRTTQTGSYEDTPSDTQPASYNGEEMDNYNYSKRIVRFYSPRPGVLISSPYYWDICYSDVWDVYYDTWAFALPSYAFWSYAYDPWYYNRWWYRSCWDYTWGWYDPFWGYSYWGWHRPLYWGWHRPCYGGWAHSGHHFNPHWDRPVHNPGGGRNLANHNGYQITSGSAGGRLIHGGTNNRTNISTQPSTVRNRLDKSFRTGSFNNTLSQQSPSYNKNGNINSTLNSTGGGGFSRSSSSSRAFSSSNRSQPQSSYNSRSNSPSSSYTPSDNKTSEKKTYTPSKSYNNSSSSSHSNFSSGSRSSSYHGGGGFSRGGGSSHSGGGGGFSRGGGGRR